jgi:predicted dinucleotide-binding enzyme
VAEFARGATVIKAFNALGTEALQRPDFGDFLAETYVCGDHEQGKAVAMDLARELGLAAIDCGGLQRARLLEPLALLRHELAHTDGYGADLVFRLMKRA